LRHKRFLKQHGVGVGLVHDTGAAASRGQMQAREFRRTLPKPSRWAKMQFS
jgi:hypothetical protein